MKKGFLEFVQNAISNFLLIMEKEKIFAVRVLLLKLVNKEKSNLSIILEVNVKFVVMTNAFLL